MLEITTRLYIKIRYTPCFKINGFLSQIIEYSQMPRGGYNKAQRQNLQRILAASFITQKIGYGYAVNYVVLKKKNIEITANCYTNAMTAIIRTVYRSIQQFLKNDIKRKVNPISPEQFRMLRSPLVQVREWLYKEQLQTFNKFVRFAYNLIGDTHISIEEARRLHGQIILTLQKQIKTNLQLLNKKKGKRSGFRNGPTHYMAYRLFEKQF